MRFASLGSGSRGNATVMAADDTCLLVDCGFTLKETELRLARLTLSASDLTGVLVTHEHGDHIRGVGALARKYGLPVYSTFGTRHAVAGGRQSLDEEDWREALTTYLRLVVWPHPLVRAAAGAVADVGCHRGAARPRAP